MALHPTLYSFTNRWECDENDHLNVQFYFSRFDEADQQFRLITGLSDALVGARRVRHVRYHKELRTGDLITVHSGIAFDGPHMLTVVHELRNAGTGDLSATAIDGYEPSASTVKSLRQRFKDHQCPMSELASPRGLPASPANNKPALDKLLQNGGGLCFRGTVLPRHVNADGKADDQFALACCTDAVPHVWERSPLTHTYLSEHNLGRVAMEMKLIWHTPLKSGDAIVVASGFTGAQAKTFGMRHHIYESRTSRLAATLDVVALAMDLDARKAIELPEAARKAIAKIQLD
ncbi:thioesterase family protein [Labrenzia sp. PHM005]|uniref:acyl-CoA thioesterase n=1 Tax=Labrenzia sp. PHM005 TaxID=2590016 RepID=UPI00114006F8|nr:thioesterase family protein [Labrenzia sp. PHM005]QDG78798.1 thioesterase [Labrenzia sp. PHM005]